MYSAVPSQTENFVLTNAYAKVTHDKLYIAYDSCGKIIITVIKLN